MDFDRIAVTGGSGRLGRFVVAELAGHARVTILDTAPPRDPGHDYRALDIRDLDAVARALAGHDAVVHLAAIDDGVPASEYTYFETNVVGTWNVLQAAHELGIAKAAITSSAAALGLLRHEAAAPPRYLPIDEAHPLEPADVYALSKEAVEAVGRSFARRGVTKVVCLRPTLVVRPEVVGQLDNMAKLAAGDPAGDPDYDISGIAEPSREPLSQTRSYVRPHDVARCFRMALEADTGAYDLFYAAARDTIGRIDTLAQMRAVFGRLPEVRKPEVYEADPAASILDSSHAREVLGWEPQGNWADYVAAEAG